MRALITGGAGFIGSHLADRLVADGHDVTVFDDLSTGRIANLDHVPFPGVRFVRGSVLDEDLVRRVVDGVDVVFHLAAAVGAFVIQHQTLQSLRTNVHGTENVLTAALDYGTRVVVASSSEVYGKNVKIGIREDDDRVVGSPTKTRWSYSEAKALDETLAQVLSVEQGLPATIVRFFNTVGPRQSGRYGMVVPRFVRQALSGEPLTVFGTGDQVRCFCHVHDVVTMLPALAELAGTPPGVVNLGSAEPVSIMQLARRVIDATGSDSPVVRVPYEEAYGAGYEDLERRVPDCARARQLLGFRPAHSLDDIIDSVVADQTGRAVRSAASM